MRLALSLLCVACLAACDFTPAIEIETPAFEPTIVVRSVLAAGQVPVVRLSLSQDPLVAPVDPRDRRPSQTPAGASVALFRDGRLVETLAPREQTCYAEQRSVCNAATGQVETARTGPYDCSAFGGQMPVEAGATYTIRASVPGLPPAEATVTIPLAPDVAAQDDGSDAETRRLSVRVRDAPGAGTRYALSVYRQYDAFRTQVCRVGGPRDTVITIQNGPYAYSALFSTTDPVLLADVPVPTPTLRLAPFTDATFMDGEATVRLTLPREDGNPNVRQTDGLIVVVSTLSADLYAAYLTAEALFSEENPFAEPAELPGNVVGGFGVVGASATTPVVVPPRRGSAQRRPLVLQER